MSRTSIDNMAPGPESIISDALFSIIIFIYVAVTFLYVFYAFCFNSNPKKRRRKHKEFNDDEVCDNENA